MIQRRRLEDLVLARLSIPTKSRRSRSALSDSLFRFVSNQLSRAEWRAELTAALARLREIGAIDESRLALTEAGRRRLCEALRVESLPKVRTWAEFRRRHLWRLVDGGTPAPAGTHPALLLVARKLGLPPDAAKSESALVNAWLAESLGIRPRKMTLNAIRAALIAKPLGVPPRPTAAEVLRISARTLAGSRTAAADDVVAARAAAWLEEAGAETRAAPDREQAGNGDATASSERLIEKIRRAARAPLARRFGPSKVFIASVWDALRADPEVRALGEQGFKRLLVEAHQRGALRLSRADLVAAMDPADVAASETRHLNATYHFIQVSGDQP